jgi:hypothetical protein
MMAKVTGDAEIGPVHRRHAKYPWDEWQDGRIWEIQGDGQDFTTSPRYMQTQLHVRARHIGRQVTTRVRDSKITFTFQKKDESDEDFRARTQPSA